MENEKKPSFNVINEIAIVSKKVKNSKLKILKTPKFKKAEANLNNYFGTTAISTWILCVLLYEYFENNNESCSQSSLTWFFRLDTMSGFATLRKDLEFLLSKKLITNSTTALPDNLGITNNFMLAREVINAIFNNEWIDFTKLKGEGDLCVILKRLGELYSYTDDISVKILQTQNFEVRYKETEFIRDIKKNIPDNIHARMFLYKTSNDFLKGEETNLNLTIDSVYNECDKFSIARNFMEEKHILINKNYIEFVKKGIITEATTEISQKTKELLFKEDAELFIKTTSGTEIIQPEKIKSKELFYEPKTEKDIDRIFSSLQENKLKLIQERLNSKGLPKGITILLYGGSGTGKTESVYQIAKKTGRKILHVDISNSKSCWFGESEKKIKRIFVDYNNLCKACKNKKDGRMPILLFNEADGIFSKRKEIGTSSCDQTENAIQNILLEEIEKMEGILIATTNLANNLDAAFERRFLFKIQFENPSVESKNKIWKSKLEWLGTKDTEFFAKTFDFSGGQIDNIVRKVTMDEILTGKHPSKEELLTLCKNEKINGPERKIGFLEF